MARSSRNINDLVLPGILAGVVLGVFCGLFFGPAMIHVKFLGDLFMNALKAVIVPLIMASMIVGVAGLGDVRRLGRMGIVTIVYYMLTTGISVTIGLVVSNIISPGSGIPLEGAVTPELVRSQEFSFVELITSLVPDNVFNSMANLEVLPLIVASLIFGGVLTAIGKEGEPVIHFFEGLNKAMMKIVQLIMLYAPIGIFGLIAALLGSKGGGQAVLNELFQIGKFVFTVVLGLSVHALFVLPTIFLLVGGRSLLKYVRNMSSAFMTAFSTDSSAATLPITMDCVVKKNKVSEQTGSFVLPLGATMNMDGTALYEACAALFIAQAWGIDLTLMQQLVVFLTATLASIGAAAIPHAGLVTMVIVLKAVDLPIEGIGLVLTVDWFLDRCRTTVNVWGDSVGATVVERFNPPLPVKSDR